MIVAECQIQIDRLLKDLGVDATKRNTSHSMTADAAMKIHASNIETLRSAPEGSGNYSLNLAAYFAGRCADSNVLGQSEAQTRALLLRIVCDEWKKPHDKNGANATFESGWNSGRSNPLTIIDSEQARKEALARIDAMLASAEKISDIHSTIEDTKLLNEMDYETRRVDIADRLKIRVSILDQQMPPRTKSSNPDDLQGETLKIAVAEPWESPVDGSALLQQISDFLNRFIVFEKVTDAYIVSLWALGTYCTDCYSIFPRLGITSPDAECGKTSLLDILGHLVNRALITSNLTMASAFRVIELLHPTLLIDELDSFLEDLPELVNVLNSGHKKGGFVFRVVGENQDVRQFSTYGPVAYCMIGKPKGTLRSRTVLLRMLRKSSKQKTEDFNLEERPELAEELKEMTRKSVRWATDHEKDVRRAHPDTGKFTNRQRDNWRAFLKIADVSGGVWPERVFDAAGIEPPKRKESFEVRLLRDIRNIFESRNVQQIPSTVLVADLILQKENPWSRYREGRYSMDASQLGEILDAFDIDPKPIRLTKEEQLAFSWKEKGPQPVIRGYKREWFSEAIERLLGDEEPEIVPVSNSSNPQTPW